MENNSKSFGLTTFSVNNTKTIFLIAFIILVGGLIAYTSMPKENFPELKIPEIYVGIAKPGSSPEYMSKKLRNPLKKKLVESNLWMKSIPTPFTVILQFV
jgi:multidrug efflux pump subunit AcrB